MGDDRVSVFLCDADLGPVMKLLPTLQRLQDPGALVLTVDDDAVYPRRLLETLLDHHARMPDAALGFRGFRIPPSGRYLDARILHASEVSGPHEVDVLCGVAGALYQRGHFGDHFFEVDGLPPEGFFVDDICISGHLHRRGRTR